MIIDEGFYLLEQFIKLYFRTLGSRNLGSYHVHILKLRKNNELHYDKIKFIKFKPVMNLSIILQVRKYEFNPQKVLTDFTPLILSELSLIKIR